MAQPQSDGTITLSAEIGVATITLDSKAYWLDLADRASKTFVQNLLIFLGAGATIVSVPWPQALSAAGLATLATVLLAVSTASLLSSGHFLIDVADRAARTFAGTLLAAIPLSAGAGFGSVDWPQALSLAGTAVVVSILTSIATTNLGASKGVPSLAPVGAVIDIDHDDVEVIDTIPTDPADPYVGHSGGPAAGRHSEKD